MAHNGLKDLLTALEYGTNLHISVVFLQHYGNKKTRIPFRQRIHQCPVCDYVKEIPEGRDECIRCRNAVLQWIIRHKRSFGGLCVKGVYEFCRPVVRDGTVAAVVFVGNVFNGSTEQRQRLRKYLRPALLKTMQSDFPQEDCARVADIVESYIQYLLDRYGETTQNAYDVLIENIKAYIVENLVYDFSITDLANMFNYNDKYLGRLFKSKTGMSIREYCNTAKIDKAKSLLKYSDLTIGILAQQSGFNNVTYFNRIFRKVTGLSPLEYRQQSRQT